MKKYLALVSLLVVFVLCGCRDTKKVVDTNQKNNIVEKIDSVASKDSVSIDTSIKKEEVNTNVDIVETNIVVTFDDSTKNDFPLFDVKNYVLNGKNIKSIEITTKETKHSETQKNEVETFSFDSVKDSTYVSGEKIDKSQKKTTQKDVVKANSGNKLLIVIVVLVCVLLYLIGYNL